MPNVERDPVFNSPVFIISPPRSGSTLLFETLSQAKALFTTGQESHGLIEGIQGLRPAQLGFSSNRFDESMATPAIVDELRRRFHTQMRDRDGTPPQTRPYRLLEKTPKNALRIPFLRQAFPEARFIYLYRDPRQTLSSMIEAWQSGYFRTYPNLPGWTGLPWSLLLIPGWRDLAGSPLHHVVARQWEVTTRILLDDLENLPADRCHAVEYDKFLSDPMTIVTGICEALNLEWDRSLGKSLPLSCYTVSRPAANKWHRHREVIEQVLPEMQGTIDRAQAFLTR
jgi:hypothetical protein